MDRIRTLTSRFVQYVKYFPKLEQAIFEGYIAINKVDLADPEIVMDILRKEPNSFAVSVKSGFGIAGLVTAIESDLPHPNVEITTVVPYSRGDLVSAIHERGDS
jgi:GTP-binding protein HflX